MPHQRCSLIKPRATPWVSPTNITKPQRGVITQKAMPQSLAHNYLHLIFSTKERTPWLTDDIRPDLHAYMATVLSNLKSPATIINSVEDHIHILFNLHRTITLSKAVEEVKKSSSKWLKTQSPSFASFYWQSGYGAFSVSESNIPQVAHYVKKQQEHHQRLSYQDELIAFLQKHKIKYDDRYLWD